MVPTKKIVGRYAPSPTGDLHLGNLRTALLAWLHARLQGGEFFLRMEDLDTPRTVSGAASRILRDLEWLGLDWDGDVLYQSQRHGVYQAALDQLSSHGLIYDCFCSRKDIQTAVSAPHGKNGVYPGTCLNITAEQIQAKRRTKTPAQRVKVAAAKITFDDQCLGLQQQVLAEQVGDFVVKRADGLFAYQLAVVVDDVAQGVTDVVRGADLIDSTARQIYLVQLLTVSDHQSEIRYCHVPLMMDDSGSRMAKRDGSESIQAWQQAGNNKQQLVAYLAASLGLWHEAKAVSAQDLLTELNFDKFSVSLTQFK